VRRAAPGRPRVRPYTAPWGGDQGENGGTGEGDGAGKAQGFRPQRAGRPPPSTGVRAAGAPGPAVPPPQVALRPPDPNRPGLPVHPPVDLAGRRTHLKRRCMPLLAWLPAPPPPTAAPGKPRWAELLLPSPRIRSSARAEGSQAGAAASSGSRGRMAGAGRRVLVRSSCSPHHSLGEPPTPPGGCARLSVCGRARTGLARFPARLSYSARLGEVT